MKNESVLRHIGINFVIAPAPIISQQMSWAFQQAIYAEGLDFGRADTGDDRITLVREMPSPLEISVRRQEGPVGQLLIVAPFPRCPFGLFVDETESVVAALRRVWPLELSQLVHCDATLRVLRETTSRHAFQELWENVLAQPAGSLKVFGRPVRGGGLRFVLDPLPTDDSPAHIDVKVESFLEDTSKIFVELQFIWPHHQIGPADLAPRDRLMAMWRYLEHEVESFLTGGTDVDE